MPIRIPNNLPAKKLLAKENIFVMGEKRAAKQDIRPLEIALLNLMPTKVETETQLARVLGNTPLQVNFTLLTTDSYQPKHTSKQHLISFYKTFADVKDKKFDGLVVTGAPVELLDWSEVKYWDELKRIFDWSVTNVCSSLFICWGAQAALQHFHKVPKHKLPQKKFGVFLHRVKKKNAILLRGFDEEFWVPVSRNTETRAEDLKKVKDLEILADSKDSGVYLVRNKKRKQIFAFNHPEYDRETLLTEFERDRAKDANFPEPENYFDEKGKLLMRWQAHTTLLFSNWLNYYVYQETPFDLSKI
ncbi:homoserine O-succinyltransferase [Candidatus Gracilibacteria bacterium]|nr:homoserine O-succinyltransferase [Candidatus Gracilibacteria bacterium]MCF7856162.1 homoserine O-succinyltransferase [Candidatus Gracilibacteria bacterium]MCF7896628.1 homoserine O-succinyltransferase [Candidatus Gracilibacteria bacterium]